MSGLFGLRILATVTRVGMVWMSQHADDRPPACTGETRDVTRPVAPAAGVLVRRAYFPHLGRRFRTLFHEVPISNCRCFKMKRKHVKLVRSVFEGNYARTAGIPGFAFRKGLEADKLRLDYCWESLACGRL
jgi:hypothetical protein